MARRRQRKRRCFQVPSSLENLHVKIREDGRIDLGVSRDAILSYLQATESESDEKDTSK
jgi:hypothetical protein